jgi:hypothetical protein
VRIIVRFLPHGINAVMIFIFLEAAKKISRSTFSSSCATICRVQSKVLAPLFLLHTLVLGLQSVRNTQENAPSSAKGETRKFRARSWFENGRFFKFVRGNRSTLRPFQNKLSFLSLVMRMKIVKKRQLLRKIEK